MRRRSALLMLAATLLGSSVAWAQDAETRPATPTFLGDRGLWFVPTGEVTPTWSFSIYRTELDYNQGFTNLSFFPVTGSAGFGRVEVFGSLRAVTRIDRDLRPLFIPTNQDNGGVLNGYPFVREPWTGNDLGDLYVGGKLNLASEQRGAPVAAAIRGTLKFSTADADTGAGTGKFDHMWDGVISKEMGRTVELSGYGGVAFRGDPDDIDLSDSFRWGVGAAFGARSSLRFTAELFGEKAFDDVTWVGSRVIGTDGSVPPFISRGRSDTNTALGLTYHHPSGFFVGGGLTYRFGLENRSDVSPLFEDNSGDAVGVQFRIGFMPPWRRPAPIAQAVTPPPPVVPVPTPAPAPPPVAPAPPPAPPPVNRPPTLQAQCNPCRVVVGGTVSIVAQGQDPDGDQLTYVWSPAAGTVGDTRLGSTTWRAETVPGKVNVTVVASDGRGGQATQVLTIEVEAPPALGEILFDYDQSTIKPEAIPVLAEALRLLNENPTRSLRVEGHASREGTTEYNQALSERRAAAVREYLGMRGINPGRITSQGFGEQRPRNPDVTEEEHRLNRRVALVLQ